MKKRSDQTETSVIRLSASGHLFRALARVAIFGAAVLSGVFPVAAQRPDSLHQQPLLFDPAASAVPITLNQGTSVAVSADGATIISGAPHASFNSGAASVFVRNQGVWSPQALLKAPNSFHAGLRVAVSGDGNTAAMTDENGGCWVFTRRLGNWSDPVPLRAAINEIAISADGTTIATLANASTEVEVFVLSQGSWSSGTMLQRSYRPELGFTIQSVTISGDGKTVAAAATGVQFGDASFLDTVIFQGALVRKRAAADWPFDSALQISAPPLKKADTMKVALSYDGNTLAFSEVVGSGTAWLLANSNGAWSRPELLADPISQTSDGRQCCLFGVSLALSSDGTVVFVGSSLCNFLRSDLSLCLAGDATGECPGQVTVFDRRRHVSYDFRSV